MLSQNPHFLARVELLSRAFHIPGIAISWRDGDGGWGTLPLGKKHAEKPHQVAPETRFPIASCTKPITALAVWKTLLDTHTNPSRPVRDSWPEFRLACPETSARVTLLDLLEHRVPLPPHTWAWVAGDVNRATFVADRLPHLELIPAHALPYHYSNVMYIALGQWIEVMTGQTWEQDVSSSIFDPAGMHGKLFMPADWATSPHAATGHTFGKPAPPFVTRRFHPAAPASELWMNADEMAHWLEFMQPVLQASPPPPGGRIPGDRPHPIAGNTWTARGLRRDLFRGTPHYWHSGQCTGFTAYTGWLPEKDISVGLMCNATGAIPALEHLAFLAYDLMLSAPDALPAAEIPSAPLPPVAETAHAASPFTLPAGVYHHPGYGRCEVRHNTNSTTEACLQDTLTGPITGNDLASLSWSLPAYSMSFPLSVGEAHLSIALEPALPPIRFEKLQ